MSHIHLITDIAASPERCFDASRDIAVHLASDPGQSVLGGAREGLLGFGDMVTWRARHFGMAWQMTSKIVEYERPHEFVDEMQRGPFGRWRHRHRFDSTAVGTRMIDEVDFASPFGPVGALVDAAFLTRYMTRLLRRHNRHLRGAVEQRSRSSIEGDISRPASPFAAMFADTDGLIPTAFRDQFLVAPNDHVGVTLTGQLDHVWHRPRWLTPLLKLLGRWEILVPDAGVDVPTTLTVSSVVTPEGVTRQTWRRTMRFARVRHFPTWVIPRNDGRIEEIVGPHDLAHIVWQGRFLPPDTVRLDGVACGLQIAGRVIWLPGWLWPWLVGVMHLEQRADSLDGRRIHMHTTLRHPLLGDVFGYEGTFDVVRNA